MTEFKSGFVAMLGRTNVGKSTLVNLLVGEKVAATANKVQTTRTAIRGIVNRENSQIIFIDTPGIHRPKTKLNETMIETSFGVIKDIDLILFVIEATSDEIGRGDMRILEKIKESKKKAILIINKIDLVKKESLLKLIDLYQKEYYFEAVSPVSSSQFSLTFTHVLKLTFVPKFLSMSILADCPILFNIVPSFPIIIPLCDSLRQYIVASMS